MANKNNIDGVPPLNDVAGGEIPAYKKFSSKIKPILRKAPPQIFKGYKLFSKGNIAIAAGTMGMKWLNGEAEEAHEINTSAQNVGAPVKQFSHISGAMQIRGADRSTAIKSTEQLYNTFNNILWGKDIEAAELLQRYNIDIVKNENNTANVPKTMEKLAPIFKNKMEPQEQNTLINTLAGNNEGLELLREGLELKNLLSASSRFGLTVDPELIAKLEELRLRTTEFGAAVDGIQQKIADTVSDTFTFKNALANTIGGLTDLMTYGPDNVSIMHTLGLTSAYESEKLRHATDSNDFYQQLTLYERIVLDFGLITDGYERKYDAYYAPKNKISKPVSSDLKDIWNPDVDNTWSNNRSRDLVVPDSDSLESSTSISPDSNLVTSSESISPNDNIVSDATNISPIYPESAGGFNSGDIADVIATAMQNNRVQIELTLIDSRSGETSMLLAQGGGRISYAMAMPM
ncbi:chemotaxis protein [Yersinia alsatica]|uniref:chemotaxis protein n=1 Tax=Yersinia alsatica TaxID=2890317 RepID=UPI0011AA09DB|nr:chemotaxis protein [Yersinia alsatica]